MGLIKDIFDVQAKGFKAQEDSIIIKALETAGLNEQFFLLNTQSFEWKRMPNDDFIHLYFIPKEGEMVRIISIERFPTIQQTGDIFTSNTITISKRYY